VTSKHLATIMKSLFENQNKAVMNEITKRFDFSPVNLAHISSLTFSIAESTHPKVKLSLFRCYLMLRTNSIYKPMTYRFGVGFCIFCHHHFVYATNLMVHHALHCEHTPTISPFRNIEHNNPLKLLNEYLTATNVDGQLAQFLQFFISIRSAYQKKSKENA
jgi:hypothetical protein